MMQRGDDPGANGVYNGRDVITKRRPGGTYQVLSHNTMMLMLMWAVGMNREYEIDSK